MLLRRAKPDELNLIRGVMRGIKPQLVHAIDRTDVIPDSHLFRIIDDSGEPQQHYVVPLRSKPCLDLGIRCWHELYENMAPVPDAIRQVVVESGADGKHVYIRTPFRKSYALAAALPNMTEEQVFCLVVDLCNALYWLHRQQLDPDCPVPPLEPFEHEQVLWQIAEKYSVLRSAVNKLSRIAAAAEPFHGSGRVTATYASAAAENLRVDLHHILHFTHPPYICPGDPWLDLIRHLLPIKGNHLLYRELLINTYFDLSPPAAFFNTLFLTELQLICRKWRSSSEDGSPMIECIRKFTAQYDAPSAIPVWYMQPSLA